MELQQFVAESLRQIMAGIVEAQKSAEELGGWVMPLNHDSTFDKSGTRYMVPLNKGPHRREVQTIDFDVAVTATEGIEKRGGISVLASVVNVGGSKDSKASVESVSRLKFSLSVIFPQHPMPDSKP